MLSKGGSLVTYKVITTLDEFLKLEQAWNELAANSEISHVFMKHQWFREFIKAYHLENSLSIIAIWADGQMAAVAPIYRKPFVFRKMSAKGLSFLGSDLGLTLNFITADSGLVADLVTRLLQLEGWDVFVAENMCVEKETTNKFTELLDQKLHGYEYQIVRGFHSPYLTTEGSWDDYWNQLPPKRRNYLNRMCTRRLEKADSYEINQISTPEEFKVFLGDMFEISQKSWKANSGDHLAFDSAQGQLYVNFTPIALEHGWVTLYTIRINGELVGFEYLLRQGNNYLLLRCDYNEKYNYYSPGNSLRMAIVRSLFNRPETCEYDMGGDDDSYKLEWCRKTRKHVTITLGNQNTRGKTVMFAKNKVLPFLRKLKGTLRSNSGMEEA